MWTVAVAAALAGGFDHGHTLFAEVLDGAVSVEGVDYGRIQARRATLDAYLSGLAEAPVDTFSDAEQLAFWIDAYNALTLTLILDAWPVGSIRDLDGGNPWDARTWRVGGQDVTLNDIEHRRVRPLGDARIHAAVNCASKGCPPLRPTPFSPDDLDAQLDAAARAWVAHNAVEVDGTAVRVSPIFTWYADDFRVWAAARGEPVTPPHAATLAFLRAFGASLPPVDPAAVTAFDYDWSLNAR